MAKPRKSYICTSCGAKLPNWVGKCPSCNQWNTVLEDIQDDNVGADIADAKLVKVEDLPKGALERLKTDLEEFDEVLGGGVVRGSVILLTGEPGIGKSTLLMQLAASVGDAVYFSAEESLDQLKIRCQRLGIKADKLLFSQDRDIEVMLKALLINKPKLVIVDSIQTVLDSSISAPPGSLVQVRECGWKIQRFAKKNNIAFVIVGHITKEGVVAGPKTLEHLVDVVLSIEGEKRTGLRILRSQKNRFGSLEEVAVYELSSKGFEPLTDPLFALTKDTLPAPGRALSIAIEGQRAFLVEVQALVATTPFGYPKRMAQGIDINRLNLILAVIENRLKINLGQKDVFINIAGGINIRDTAVDLAICAAILSNISHTDLPLNEIYIGELGLLGEVRKANQNHIREKTAKKLGYTPICVRDILELRKKIQ